MPCRCRQLNREPLARKVFRPLVAKEDIANEQRAIQELCMSSCHRNIVIVFGYGWLGKEYESVFFIDMELCALDLSEYIYGQRSLPRENFFEPIHNGLFVSKNDRPLSKVRNVWAIMKEIGAGLKFIHDHNLVHRDLKPKNSIPSSISIDEY